MNSVYMVKIEEKWINDEDEEITLYNNKEEASKKYNSYIENTRKEFKENFISKEDVEEKEEEYLKDGKRFCIYDKGYGDYFTEIILEKKEVI